MSLTLTNKPIGTRIGLALALPILGLLFFAAWTVLGYHRIASDTSDLHNMASLAPAVGALVHELQQERGVSAGYAGSRGKEFEDRLADRRASTDGQVEFYYDALDNLREQGDPRLKRQIGIAQSRVGALPGLRRAVSDFQIGADELIEHYSATIDDLTGILRVMLLEGSNAELSRALNAYMQMVLAKEMSGIERAVGSAQLASGRFDSAGHARLISLIDRQTLHFEQFRYFANAEQIAALDSALAIPETAEIERMRRIVIVSRGGQLLRKIESTRWFDTQTRKIDQLKSVEDRLAADLIQHARNIETSARGTAATLNFAILLMLVLTVAIAALLARGIIDPIARITAALNRLAANDEEVEITDDRRGDEIGDMARAAVVFRDNVSRIARAEERLRSEAIMRLHYKALESILQGVLIIDYDRVITYANAAFQRITGYGEAEIIGRTPEFLYGPETDPKALTALRAALVAGDVRPHCVLCYRKDGATFWAEVSVTLVHDSDGRPTHVVSVIRDITESRNIEAELRIAAIAFESLHAMMVTDPRGVILRVNRAFTETTGYSAEEMIGNTPAMLKSNRHEPEFYADMWHRLTSSGSWEGEVWDRRKSGEIYPKWQTISSVRDADGRITHYVAAFSDISERKEAEEQIRKLAFYDPLTGLPNRRLLIDRLQRAVLTSDRTGRSGALFFIDLDQFKGLNDTRGHDVGDLLLIEVGKRLQTCLRECDTAARLGGDEFVVMLEDLNPVLNEAMRHARLVGDKILACLNEPYLLVGQIHHSTPSIGATLIRGRRCSATELLKQADVAMYQAKAAGRNTLCFFEPGMAPTPDESSSAPGSSG
ncbi:MAG: nitrate- and nitrite sensing domain-containing protein [Rhodocyclales bacterium]|nr:nitrate- and nitrite sensing domain-containing protein [Rhodocyclales bacterium]